MGKSKSVEAVAAISSDLSIVTTEASVYYFPATGESEVVITRQGLCNMIVTTNGPDAPDFECESPGPDECPGGCKKSDVIEVPDLDDGVLGWSFSCTCITEGKASDLGASTDADSCQDKSRRNRRLGIGSLIATSIYEPVKQVYRVHVAEIDPVPYGVRVSIRINKNGELSANFRGATPPPGQFMRLRRYTRLVDGYAKDISLHIQVY